MARLRVFVSSTCYDLTILRNQLRAFIEDQGHEPVMSDYNDILYDPRQHTHTSCIDEIMGCDAVIVIIGSRYGGTSIPEALEKVDLEGLEKVSASIETLKQRANISITQLEVLKAVEQAIPVFAFVEDRVWHDHATYEKNKSKKIIEEIEFSSIDKPKSARYIFEFLNFLRHRSNNNGIVPFARYSDLEESLKQQWSGLLKKLLLEQREKVGESRRIDNLTEQFEDLKAAMLSTISDDTRRKIARGVVQYRRLYDFLTSIVDYAGSIDQYARENSISWEQLLNQMDVQLEDANELPREVWRSIVGESSQIPMGPRVTAILQKSDQKIFVMYFPLQLRQVKEDFEEFMQLSKDNREIILEALEEGHNSNSRRLVRFIGKTTEEYLKDLAMPKEVSKASEFISAAAAGISQLEQER